MTPDEVLLWGMVMGALMKEPMLDVQGFVDEHGNYEEYVEVTIREGSSGTVIRLRAEHSGSLAGDAAKADLVDLLNDLRPHNASG